MKTKPTKTDRSAARWLPGAMALAATTASSQAATVQITLTGNKISSTSAGGNTLNADLTGDGNDDINLGAASVRTNGVAVVMQTVGGFKPIMASLSGYGSFVASAYWGTGVGVGRGNGPEPVSARYLNPVSFSDPAINGGAVTAGWLEVYSLNESATSHTIQLTRLIFDDASTSRPGFSSIPGVQTEWQVSAVPEPSGFAATSLLLGAAGLIRRRQARAA